MSSINRLNLFLLIIILVLAALNFLPSETDYRPLTSIAPDTIQSITISSRQRQLAFRRQESNRNSNQDSHQHSQWLSAASPGKAIDTETISKLLGILKTHSFRQFEKTEGNLAMFGLNTPQYQLTLDNLAILFGTSDPLQQHRYVLLNDKIHLISDLYLQFFLADEAFFLSNPPVEN